MKVRQYNNQKKNDRSNNDLQNITQKNKDWATRYNINRECTRVLFVYKIIYINLVSTTVQSPIAPVVIRFTVSDCPFHPSIYGSLIVPFVVRFTVLILIYDRSVVFSCFSGFIHQGQSETRKSKDERGIQRP
jgi:hypothetical protein